MQYLFVAGDLTSRARPQEFYYCETKINEIAKAAGIPLENIIWAIGNHDVDWNITGIATQYTEGTEEHNISKKAYQIVANTVAYHNTSRLPKIHETYPIPMCGFYENDDFIVFVLNSATESSKEQTIKHGVLSQEQLEWFKNKCEETKQSNKWKIILVHHHPFNYTFPVPGFDISALEEGPELLEIASKYGVHLVLHGHRHHPRAETVMKSEWENPITFICGGSLSVNAEHRTGEIPNTFHILELTDKPGILFLNNYEYKAGSGWNTVKYKQETPIDARMKLGRVTTSTEAIKIIDNMMSDLYSIESKKLEKYEWDSLPEELQYCKIDNINEWFKKGAAQYNWEVYGQFPDTIVVIKGDN